jgi:hypothetical protein
MVYGMSSKSDDDVMLCRQRVSIALTTSSAIAATARPTPRQGSYTTTLNHNQNHRTILQSSKQALFGSFSHRLVPTLIAILLPSSLHPRILSYSHPYQRPCRRSPRESYHAADPHQHPPLAHELPSLKH